MDTISRLRKEVKIQINRIISNSKEYEKFLKFSKNFYKYKEYEILAIYSQNPKATACADKETWERLGRSIDDNSKVTYTFNYATNTLRYNKLYDVYYTSGDTAINKFKWKYNENLNYEIIKKLGMPIELYINKKINYKSIDKDDIMEFTDVVIKSTMYLVNARCDKEKNIELDFNYDILSKYFKEVSINLNEISREVLKNIGQVCIENKFDLPKNKKEIIIEKVKEVEANIEENTSNEYVQKQIIKDKEQTKASNSDVFFNEEKQQENEEVETFDHLVGEIIELDGKQFEIHSADEYFIEMQDLEFKNNTIYPIYKTVSTENFVKLLNEKKVEEKQQGKLKLSTNDNDKIIEESTHRTEREKLNDNIKAIQLLKDIEINNKNITQDLEKNILRQYSGFGGIPDVFDTRKSKYEEERNILKSLLTEKQYNQLEGSTLNAHYTSKEIIASMYEILYQVGFKGGKILEPSMGNGKFFEHMPSGLKNSNLHGVELDEITGNIAKVLYPKANIQVKGFEETNFKNDYFDVAIGNVPFGNYKVYDEQYLKHKLLIHDYFIAKSLDKIKDGGIVAVITSSGTLDKQNSSARELIATKGALISAIRLPNTAFKQSANTEVVTDILIFQKGAEQKIDWINTKEIEVDGEHFNINNYFVDNPHMVIGNIEKITGRFGNKLTVKLEDDKNLTSELKKAIEYIPKNIYTNEQVEVTEDISDNIINVEQFEYIKDYSFINYNEELYFKYSETIEKVELKGVRKKRIVEQVEIRDMVREILNMQVNNCTDEELENKQGKLRQFYSDFTKKYGNLNDNANKRVFKDDADAPLLLSLEKLNNDKKTYTVSDIFYKRTISPVEKIEYVEMPIDGLFLCLNNKGYIDINYIAEVCDHSVDKVKKSLEKFIFKNPAFEFGYNNEKEYVTKESYLSGNILKKIDEAKMFLHLNKEYEKNIKELEEIKPKRILANDIRINIGMQWIPIKYYEQFAIELFDIGIGYQPQFKIDYSKYSGNWFVDKVYINNVISTKTYGTKRVTALSIFEQSLNLKKVKIYDTYIKDDREVRVINEKETELAQDKQKQINEKFKEWIFNDIGRKKDVVDIYNRKFNNTVLEKFDGSHLTFPEMTNKIQLRPHQKDAVYRILTKGNTLLSHEVGTGKTYTIVSSIMEQKRLGLAKKPMVVVPNHLVEQWSSDFMTLYPNANILAITKEDMSKNKRLAFTSRIATGVYDAIIISHSSFEKIPISKAYRENMLYNEIHQIKNALEDIKDKNTVKDLNKILKSTETELRKLHNETQKDNILNFEHLGVDSLYVDEAHLFKNLFNFTKLNRVKGVNTSRSQRATDMFLKCQLINNKINKGSRGVVFATGTPVSNSISELYTMQKYLMFDKLKDINFEFFDNWVANFGEITTKLELKPSGQGYAPTERLSEFKNVPELITIYKEVADIITNDMVDLDLPKLKDDKITIVSSKPTYELKEYTNELVDRAKDISNGLVNPRDDNMLVVTNDGRKAGLDIRLIDKSYYDNPNSKVNKCIQNVYTIWNETAHNKSTQLIFCDLSTPKTNSQDLKPTSFNLYIDIRDKLLQRGVPLNEIAFIHDCTTDIQKDELFEKVRQGEVRILLGSTQKCGAGTNIQDKLVALHDIDCPWRPADLEQRMGRIVRQGNENKEVQVIRYVTEESFDAYLWSIVETKAKFIQEVMRGESSVRHFSDDSDIVLSYGEITAIATGNPLIKESMELKTKIKELHILEQAHKEEQQELKIIIDKTPEKVKKIESNIEKITRDIEIINKNRRIDILVDGKHYDKTTEQGTALLSLATKENINKKIGSIAGLDINYEGRGYFSNSKILSLNKNYKMKFEISDDGFGTIMRIKNTLGKYVDEQEELIKNLEKTKKDFLVSKNNFGKEFEKKEKLEITKKKLEDIEKVLHSGSENSKNNKVEKVNNFDR